MSKVLRTEAELLTQIPVTESHYTKMKALTPTRRSSNLTNSALGLRPKVSLNYSPSSFILFINLPQKPKPYSFKSIAYEAGLSMRRVCTII